MLKSLEKIVKEEASKKRARDVIFDSKDNDDLPVNVNLPAPPASHLLKLKIRNTTRYLNWRLSILKRDNFTCKICHASVKENKSLRLEVHHPKAFDEICKENNVSTVEQALVYRNSIITTIYTKTIENQSLLNACSLSTEEFGALQSSRLLQSG